jgi:hypothetical protein
MPRYREGWVGGWVLTHQRYNPPVDLAHQLLLVDLEDDAGGFLVVEIFQGGIHVGCARLLPLGGELDVFGFGRHRDGYWNNES